MVESSNPRYHIWVLDGTGSPTKTWDRVGSEAEQKYWVVGGSDPHDEKQAMKYFYWSPVEWRNHRRIRKLEPGLADIAEQWYKDRELDVPSLLRAQCHYGRDHMPRRARRKRRSPSPDEPQQK